MKKLLTQKLVLTLVGLVIISLTAMAQNIPVKEFKSQPVIPAARGVVLYDQTDSPASNGFPSQEFEPAFTVFSCEGADDFTVPAGKIWDVDGITVICVFQNAPFPQNPVSLDITIYADNGGVPGPPVDSFFDVFFDPFLLSGAVVPLPSVVSLNEGTYWLSVVVDMDFTPWGQFFWNDRLALTGNHCMWRNPGDGFATGAINWTPIDVAGVGGGVATDALFRIYGTEKDNVVPLSPIAIIIGGIFIAAIVIWRYRRS